MARVLLIAAGGLAREVISSIRQTGDHDVVGLLDDDTSLHGRLVGGVRVLGGPELAAGIDAGLLVCAGRGSARAAVVDRLEALGIGAARYATHVHGSVGLGAGSHVGGGTILLAGCVATSDVLVGRHCVLMPRVTLTHDDRLGDFVTMAAGVALGGRVTVGPGAYLGMNASVRQDLAIGTGAVLGMGSVLLQDLPAGEVWAGNPARMLARHPGGKARGDAPARRTVNEMYPEQQGANP
ncbi:acetyltransferase [Paeniglutamicibacter sp. ABSL32-1]|uniref:PglD-related sugar-binding protein n=1 Tax=Paeniglutamicibacter quisquiliarum TaxID=2849498 RepID=UPI001C2D7809|nr:acetyltransferase [Paeniglutamicibacter quisquiliarum]MBV1779201.1 acetyltransferase [Paeniglutamicibacter quisquiliarum]